ncbi:ATP-dependent DNA helicase sgs1 [Clarireedia jacksonii]
MLDLDSLEEADMLDLDSLEEADILMEMASQSRNVVEKTISRRSSVDVDRQRRSVSRTTLAPRAGSQSRTTPQDLQHQPPVQVQASPTVRNKREYTSSPSPRKPPKPRPEKIIQDSDDEDGMSDVQVSAPYSTSTPKKKVPEVISTPQTSRLRDLPVSNFGEDDEMKSAKKKVGSPLRSISVNAALRQDSNPSPFQLDSPTKPSTSQLPSQQNSSQATAASALSPEEKRIVNLWINNAEMLTNYQQHLELLLAQNKAAVELHLDDGEMPPKEIIDQRKALAEKKKACSVLGHNLQDLKNLATASTAAAKIAMDLLENDCDYTVQEAKSKQLTQELHKKKREFWHLLEDAGATNYALEANLSSRRSPLPTNRSSTTASTQVILQTQVPPLRPVSSNLTRDSQQDYMSPAIVASRTADYQTEASYAPPSPRRHASPTRSAIRPSIYSKTNPPMPQPDFFQRPSSADYGADEDFEFLIQEDQERQKFTDQVPEEIEDDYGDFDDDDEAMIGIVEEVEQRNSFTAHSARPAARESSREGSRNTTKSSKRTSLSSSKTQNMYSTMDPAHANMFKYPWSEDVKRALKDRFRLKGFRQNQLDAINATLGGQDAFILMPTGGGKSLCYQLPAIVQSGKTKGVTIVVSPLLALMDDQVEHLRKLHIQASLLNGDTAPEKRDCVYGALREPCPEQFIQLLYITPEMIGKSQTLLNALANLHRKNRLARFVIDEAHCVSQWGHDFRPDYKNLKDLRMKFPGVPFIALTATATETVKLDVMSNLGMQNCKQLKQSFNRPNIYYEIRAKTGKGAVGQMMSEIKTMLKVDYKNQSGIIYCLSRQSTEDVAKDLQSSGIKAHHFHAAMTPEDKKSVQHRWQIGQLQVVVATIAFGMGIDKKDVRFVIHHTFPKTLEGYYQETGRAGRDGEPAACFLYYGSQDSKVYQRMIENGDGSDEVKHMQREMLNRMTRFCENRIDCRRVDLLGYFGETFKKEDCGHCDNCKSNTVFEEKDYTVEARKALSVVEQARGQNFTLGHFVAVLEGKRIGKIKSAGHDELEEFGSLKEWQRTEIGRLLEKLIQLGGLEYRSVFNKANFPTTYVHLGHKYRNFMSGRSRVHLQVQVSGPNAVARRKAPKPAPKKQSQPSSTMLTSPIPQSRSRSTKKGKNRYIEDDDDDDPIDEEFHPNTYAQDDIPTFDDLEESEDDAFVPFEMAATRTRPNRQDHRLGPPITADDGMQNLNAVHSLAVEDFVEDARKLEENIRNRKGHRKPYFTVLEFRNMAIHWTTDLEKMSRISDINSDNVNNFGRYFIDLVKKHKARYEQMMDPRHKTDLNHQTVIDLVSDDDGIGSEEDEDEDDGYQSEALSRYFVPPDVQAFNEVMNKTSKSATSQTTQAESSKKSSKKGSGGGFRSKGRGGSKSFRRRSSEATSISSRSRSGPSGAGVAKKKTSTGGRKTSGQSTAPKPSSIMGQFGRSGGSGGGGGNFGIAPMPT